MSLTIDISIEDESWNVVGDIDALARSAVDAALAESGETLTPDTEVSIVLCDDAFIQELNAKWRGKDKPTNVLSFPADFQDAAPALGDIIIAYETVAREAAEEGKSLRDHLSHMIVHGFSTFSDSTTKTTRRPRRWSWLKSRHLPRSASPLHMRPLSSNPLKPRKIDAFRHDECRAVRAGINGS